MNYRRLFRLSLWAVALTVLLQLMPKNLYQKTQLLTQIGTATVPSDNFTFPTEITQPPADTEAVLSFSESDLDRVKIQYLCDYRPDLAALLTADLGWTPVGKTATVLIIHTHGSESFSGDYEMVESYRTLDETLNMIAIGDEVARILELGGIQVVHDRNIYDYPDYSGAYSAARSAIKIWLDEYPGIVMVLDLHRDAGEGDYGSLVTAATVGGQRCAQLMMVVGTDASGSRHSDWQRNLSLALKLTAVLEAENPGITRPIALRSQRFNMDLTPGSLLVEVGAAGNTLEEAKIAANALAIAVLKLLGK